MDLDAYEHEAARPASVSSIITSHGLARTMNESLAVAMVNEVLRYEGVAFCAGRVAVAHERTPMQVDGDDFVCGVCGERWVNEVLRGEE